VTNFRNKFATSKLDLKHLGHYKAKTFSNEKKTKKKNEKKTIAKTKVGVYFGVFIAQVKWKVKKSLNSVALPFRLREPRPPFPNPRPPLKKGKKPFI